MEGKTIATFCDRPVMAEAEQCLGFRRYDGYNNYDGYGYDGYFSGRDYSRDYYNRDRDYSYWRLQT